MKEANPWIFRSLEKAAGSAEFDTIVAAAVASYGALRHPREAKAREFADLVLPVWDRLKPETRRALGAALCHSTNVPRGIVEKLLAEPIEIAAPFLLSSPVLTENDRRFLAESRDVRLHRIARETASAREPAAEPPLSALEPSAAPQPKTVVAAGAPLTAESSLPPPRVEAQPRAEPGEAAEAVREALRRMVRPGARKPSAALMTPSELVDTAVLGDGSTTLAGLAVMAGIDEPTLSLIVEDDTGERLAVALKAVGLRDADAMTVMMMVKPKVGLDVIAFDLMARYYRSLQREDCAAILGLRRRVEAPALEPIFEDIQRLERPVARSAFGRRTMRPDLKSRKA